MDCDQECWITGGRKWKKKDGTLHTSYAVDTTNEVSGY